MFSHYLRYGCCVLTAGFTLAAAAAAPPKFPAGAVWHQRVDASPLHANSAGMISTLSGLGGWGNNNKFQIDFSIHVSIADPGAPTFPVVQHKDYADYFSPDCEATGTAMPVPPGAMFEGQVDPGTFTCNNSGEDCHLLVVQGGLLYEAYAANFSNNEIDALCLAIWDLDVVYPPEGRGEHCTSADGAGFPVAPLLFNADEVAAAVAEGSDSDLGHAIRFILPNGRMANDPMLGTREGRLYVRPATHSGSPSGPIGSVPYGVRMRLKSGFDMSGYNAASQVILRTMQRYGIVLSDGGNIALTGQSDDDTVAKWDDLNVDSQSLLGVDVTDFEVVDTGPRIGETWDCVRSPVIPGGGLFQDGFED